MRLGVSAAPACGDGVLDLLSSSRQDLISSERLAQISCSDLLARFFPPSQSLPRGLRIPPAHLKKDLGSFWETTFFAFPKQLRFLMDFWSLLLRFCLPKWSPNCAKVDKSRPKTDPEIQLRFLMVPGPLWSPKWKPRPPKMMKIH